MAGPLSEREPSVHLGAFTDRVGTTERLATWETYETYGRLAKLYSRDLRVLALHIWAHKENAFDLARIHELSWLRYLKIVCNIPVKLPDIIQQQQNLEVLEVYATLLHVPLDIGDFHKLVILKIVVRKLSSKDICFLQSLFSLTDLSVHVKTEPTEKIIFDKGGFPVVEVFTFRCAPHLLIQENAMPKLHKLKLCLTANVARQYDIITIQHLPSLTEISVKISGSSDEAKHDLFCTIQNDPANPRLQLLESMEDRELGTLEEQYENMETYSDKTYEVQNRVPIEEIGNSQVFRQVLSLDMHPSKPWIMTSHHGGQISICNYETKMVITSFKVSEKPGLLDS